MTQTELGATPPEQFDREKVGDELVGQAKIALNICPEFKKASADSFINAIDGKTSPNLVPFIVNDKNWEVYFDSGTQISREGLVFRQTDEHLTTRFSFVKRKNIPGFTFHYSEYEGDRLTFDVYNDKVAAGKIQEKLKELSGHF